MLQNLRKLQLTEIHFADQKGLGLVTMPSVYDRCDIDINNIAVLQNIVARDSVADHFVDAGATTFGIAQVAEGCGRVLVLVGKVDDESIYFFC